jgi:hypothetical protein
VSADGVVFTRSAIDERYFDDHRRLAVTAADKNGARLTADFDVQLADRPMDGEGNSTRLLKVSEGLVVGAKLIALGEPNDNVFYVLLNQV